MIKSIFIPLLFILTLSGCANTVRIEKEQTTDEYYMSINKKCEKEYVVLALQDKVPLRVYNVNVGIDSTTWMDITNGKYKTVQTSNVYSVQVTDRAGGALTGLGYGTLGGALAGAAYVSAVTGPTSHPGFSVIFGAIGGALVGAIAGPVLGVTIGKPSYFIINEKEQKVK